MKKLNLFKYNLIKFMKNLNIKSFFKKLSWYLFFFTYWFTLIFGYIKSLAFFRIFYLKETEWFVGWSWEDCLSFSFLSFYSLAFVILSNYFIYYSYFSVFSQF